MGLGNHLFHARKKKGLSLDELVEFDIDIKEIQEVIDRTSEGISDKIDWTKAWSRKYPVLARQEEKQQIDFGRR